MGVAAFVLRQRADRIAQIGVLAMGLSPSHIYRRAWEHPAWLQAGLDRYSSFLHVLNAVANALPEPPVACKHCRIWVPASKLVHLVPARLPRVLPPLTWVGNTRAPVMPAANVKTEGRSAESPEQSIEKSAVRSEETPTCESFRHSPEAEE